MALDKLLQWANIAYLVCLLLVAGMSFVIYHLSARVNTAKDRELEKYRTESTIKITAAQAEAAEAMKIAESEAPRASGAGVPSRCRRGPRRGGECRRLAGTARA